MELSISILLMPVVTKDLSTSPRFTSIDFLSRCIFSNFYFFVTQLPSLERWALLPCWGFFLPQPASCFLNLLLLRAFSELLICVLYQFELGCIKIRGTLTNHECAVCSFSWCAPPVWLNQHLCSGQERGTSNYLPCLIKNQHLSTADDSYQTIL